MNTKSIPSIASVAWCCAALIAIGISAVNSAEPKPDPKTENKLIGTWKLISGKYGGQESPLLSAATTLKHVTPSHFIWVSYGEDGRVTRAAGGTYILTGEQYQETPEYGISNDFDAIKGKTHKFKWKVEGNRWYHTGELSSGLTIEEVWERVEKK